MPSKQSPIIREWRPSAFDDEILDLFVEMERLTERQRRLPDNAVKTKRLAIALGHGLEWMWNATVNDCAGEPCWPENMPAHQTYRAIQAKRAELLAAARARGDLI